MSQVWFITGASRGLGLAIAQAALGAGHRVVAAARRASDAAKALGDHGDRLLTVALDVTDASQAEAAVTRAVERFARIDVLVNNAGTSQLGPFETVSAAQVERQFATNVLGTLHVTRAVLPVMRAQRSGRVLTLSSVVGVVGYASSSIYCASKFALEGWSESLAQEVARFGVQVTLIEPGMFRTGFMGRDSTRLGEIVIGDYAGAVAQHQAMIDGFDGKQPGDPAKLGQAVVTIAASEEAPVRIAVGPDAVEAIVGKADRMRAEVERWRALSEATNLVG